MSKNNTYSENSNFKIVFPEQGFEKGTNMFQSKHVADVIDIFKIVNLHNTNPMHRDKHKKLPMHVLLHTTLDLLRLCELMRDSSILTNVWSPDAPIQVALRPYFVPIFGMSPGIAFQLESLSLSDLRLSLLFSSEAPFGGCRLNWLF